MRKLTLLATTAVAAMALMAAAAAPAHADREFVVTDPEGNECAPTCLDTGYEGTFAIKSSGGSYIGECDVVFDMEVDNAGALNTYNTVVDSCVGYGVTNCDDSWPGQLRIPDTGPGEIDLTMCFATISGGTYHDITLTVTQPPGTLRTWNQIDETLFEPVWDTHVEDQNPADNVKAQIIQ